MMMEFHIARSARERYRFEASLFSFNGNVVFADLDACRAFALRMNQVRDAAKNPDQTVHAGALFAMGLIDEASHAVLAQYRKKFDPEVMTAALDWFGAQVGSRPLDKLLVTFVEHFPGQSVMRGEETPRQWLSGKTDGVPHRAAALEELLMLWTANRNQAFTPFKELFEDKPLAEKTVYNKVTQALPTYFATRPLIPIEGGKVNLLDLLRAPSTGAPTSLADQLALIRQLWRPLLGDALDRILQIAGEILREEERAIWMMFNPEANKARESAEAAARRRREQGTQQWPSIVSTSQVPTFGDPAFEYEKFSADTAWMPSAVLIAKSTWVWLAQLSKQYGRHIYRLDDIPDEELQTLADRGLNTLWLIGIWERSRASKTIKQLCGNSDAVASAYSLYDYRIAEDLGGEAAYITLRDRAYRHGLRLASDMVPNHMGIDSPWVVEHPEWFIARPAPPYPAYTFNGPDLSSDSRVEIRIEDHYYEQTDAAVVFQRRDRATGETRYIYHGNDGTSFPWNDTAQLDYLNPAVREQVIQTILHVARLFPVIRFDAAMTLAKRHFHRLWFPGPGSSGAIPSRAEYSMSDEEFNRIVPLEFWREVVDRVAAEVPGTLLLAEAFWLMEGYFVRTLGMHRVYNSAFMNMLRDEKNAEYRSVIKNTLEFDPDIMKRYVNFMSNPDERTAIDQFGTGDKCFGVAVLMSTLPGLPMFGHGQVEGFTEKYGMEYQRPRYDESPNQGLVERHQREVAPLLKKRWLFAESRDFLLYDFYDGTGAVDENVFAYSNRSGGEQAIVVYNNRYSTAHGTIDNSAAYADKGAGCLRQRRLSEGLGLTDDPGVIFSFRDSLTDMHYLHRASDLAAHGLTLSLHAYECHVFLDWRELRPSAAYPWDRLCDKLNGAGVANLDEALALLELEEVHAAIAALLDPALVHAVAALAELPAHAAAEKNLARERAALWETLWHRAESVLHAVQRVLHVHAAPALWADSYRADLRAVMRLPAVEDLFPGVWPPAARRVLPSASPLSASVALWGPVLAWCVLRLIARYVGGSEPHSADQNPGGTTTLQLTLFDRLRLREPFARAFQSLGIEGEDGWRAAARIKVLLLMEAAKPPAAKEPAAAETEFFEDDRTTEAGEEEPALPPALWLDPDLRWLASVHAAETGEYLVREPYEELLWWLQLPGLLELAAESAPMAPQAVALVNAVTRALDQTAHAGYRADLLAPQPKPEPAPETLPGSETKPAAAESEPAIENLTPEPGESAEPEA